MRAISHFIALGALLLFLSACSEPTPPPKPKEPARAVNVAQVELRSISGRTEATGLLVPREEIAVGSELSGFRVAEVLVEEGATVAKGEPLARLDDTLLRAKLAQARANFQLVQSEADRVKGLDGSGVLSDEEIAQRRGQASVAKAQLDDVVAQTARMTVRAPTAGLVLERNVRPGSVSGGAEPMFRIARDELIELDAEVPEEALASIEPGSVVSVSISSGRSFEGTVRLISPRIDPQTKLGRVRVKLPIDSALRAGGFGSAIFQRLSEPVSAVPEKAVQFEASGPLLVEIDADNRAHRILIRTGARAEGFVEIIDGPAPGSRVALGGGAFLLDGDLVAPVQDNESDQSPPPGDAPGAAEVEGDAEPGR